LEIMYKIKALDGLSKRIKLEYLKCATCIENKMQNLPFHNNRRRVENVLEIVYTDLNGLHQTTGYQREKYFLSFIDDYSKLVKVYCIRTKDEVYEYLAQYVNEIQNLTGKMIKELRLQWEGIYKYESYSICKRKRNNNKTLSGIGT